MALTTEGETCLIARLSLHQNQGHNHETHLSTLGCSPQAYARLSRSHAHEGWPQGHRRASCQGPPSSGCLNLATSRAAGAGGIGETAMAQLSAGFSFPRRYRLTKTDEYSSVFGFRRAVKSTHFLLHYRPRDGLGSAVPSGEGARLGIVVPKKLVKAAVRRNLIKRLARERFRHLRSELPACDLVLRLAVRPARELLNNRRQLAAEISELLLGLKRRRID